MSNEGHINFGTYFISANVVRRVPEVHRSIEFVEGEPVPGTAEVDGVARARDGTLRLISKPSTIGVDVGFVTTP